MKIFQKKGWSFPFTGYGEQRREKTEGKTENRKQREKDERKENKEKRTWIKKGQIRERLKTKSILFIGFFSQMIGHL